MAIVATLGASDANSYVTLADANVYFTNRMHSSAWESLDDPSVFLISASRMLDWYTTWKGYKTSEDQSMQWPRTGAIRPSGVELDDDVLPPEIKIAVYELAFSNISADPTALDELEGIDQLKAGSLMIKATTPSTSVPKAPVIPSHVKNILSDLVINSGGVIRLLRA